jgi:16S rRNA (guanine527-N7)-methyltransferase
VAAGEAPADVLDLGSGGGVPGLVLLALWPLTEGVLLDAGERRSSFLSEAVTSLGWAGRVQVVRARAEEAGRHPHLRAHASLVVSRSFGPPAVVAECAAPLLKPGGRLIVSEPPAGDDRWPLGPLASLGMAVGPVIVSGEARFQVLRQEQMCPSDRPRRVGVPAKRPLW